MMKSKIPERIRNLQMTGRLTRRVAEHCPKTRRFTPLFPVSASDIIGVALLTPIIQGVRRGRRL